MTFKFSAASCVLALVLTACGGGTGGTSNPSVTGTPAPMGPTPTPTSIGTTPTPTSVGTTPTVTPTPTSVGTTPTVTPTPTSVGTTPTVTPTPAGSSAGYFIKGTVNAAVRNGTVDVTGSWVNDGGAGSGLTAKTTDSPAPAVWSIQHLKNVVGTYSCNGGSGNNIVAITFSDPTVVVNPITDAPKLQVTTAGSPGACSVTVTAASATEVEGTFTATLHNNLGYTRTVTNGAFKVAKTN